MEQFLEEKIKNYKNDEIDNMMITARIVDFHQKFLDLCSKFYDDLKEFVSEKKMEMALSDYAVIMSVIDDVQKEIPIRLIVGRQDLCKKALEDLGEAIKNAQPE